MLSRQQDAMVELIDNFLQPIAQSDKVEDVGVFVERPGQLDRGPPVVAVKPLADVPVERDEMSGTEDQVVLRDANSKCF